MDYLGVWIACSAIGIVLLLCGPIWLLIKKGIRKWHYAVATGLEFAASLVLYFPYEYNMDIPASSGVSKLVESIATSIVKTLNIYQGNGYERLFHDEYPVFSSVYTTVFAVSSLLMVVFAAGFIIRFFEGPFQQIKLKGIRNRHVFVFSCINEKNLLIAESLKDFKIQKNDETTREIDIPPDKKVAIFLTETDDIPTDIKERIEDLNGIDGIYVMGSLQKVFAGLIRKLNYVELFLFEDNEEDNLDSLERIKPVIDDEFNGKDKGKLKIFVGLSNTPWDLYNGFLKEVTSKNSERKEIVVNFVRVEENFVYNNLLKNSIFKNAVPAKAEGKNFYNNISEIRILIVGMNERNLEFLRAIMHLSQMPGYKPIILVLDDREQRGVLNNKMPEIFRDTDSDINEYYVDGDAVYKLIYKENVKFDTDAFESIIETALPQFTFAFVNAGDDLLNFELASRLDVLRYRSYSFNTSDNLNYTTLVSVRNKRLADRWRVILNSQKGPDVSEVKNEFKKKQIEYIKNKIDNPLSHIVFVGSDEEVYNYNYITMSDIESATKKVHEVRQTEKAKNNEQYKIKTWQSYYNNEYNRHSVYARTLSLAYKVNLVTRYLGADYKKVYNDSTWLIYEHMRWNMYTRTLGYIYDKYGFSTKSELFLTDEDKTKLDELNEDKTSNDDPYKKFKKPLRDQGKVHDCLVPFENLPTKETDKDSISLTKGVVEALIGITEQKETEEES